MAVKTRWDKKTYRRHMFNVGRKVRSPHETSNTKQGTNEFVDSQIQNGGFLEASWRSPWAGKLDAAKEYEQYNNPKSASWSPFTFDSTERREFREQDRKEVRKLFQEQLANHHFSKHKKATQGQLNKIVDAYMSQDDDKFKESLGKMGITGKDADRWRRAAEESAATAIEGTEASTGWSDDDYRGATEQTGQASQAGQVGVQGAGPKNGTPQVSGAKQAAGASRVAGTAGVPPVPARAQKASDTNRWGDRAGDSGNIVDGARVRIGNNATQNHIDESQSERTATDAIYDAEARKDAQNQARGNVRRRAQDAMRTQLDQDKALDAIMKERADRRNAMVQQRRDKRYESRLLSNEDDWKNLAREGSNRRSYEATANETPEQKAEREAALAERNKGIAALRDRLAQMADTTLVDTSRGEKVIGWENGKPIIQYQAVVKDPNDNNSVEDRIVSDEELAARKASFNETRGTDATENSRMAYANSFYENNPNRRKDLAALSSLVQKAGNSITDAQLEAVTKKLDSWQAEADRRKANVDAMNKLRDAEYVSGLRQKYGMGDINTYSAKAVKDFHERYQKRARTDILKDMQVAPAIVTGGSAASGDATASGEASMAKFAQGWQKLLDNGFDPNDMFNKSMANPENKKAYDAAFDGIKVDDPDVNDKRDQLRRRFIMQQAMEEHGIKATGGETGAAGAQVAPQRGQDMATAMSQNLPGQRVLVPRSMAGQPPARPGAGALVQAGAELPAQPAQTGAEVRERNREALGGLRPPPLPRKKKEDEGTMAAMMAGVSALRPRRRS